MRKSFILVLFLFMGIVNLSMHLVFADTVIEDTDTSLLLTGNYKEMLSSWENEEFLDNSNFTSTILPSDFSGLALTSIENSFDYTSPVYEWIDETKINFTVSTDSKGLYQFALDFYSLSEDYLDLEMMIYVNGEIQYTEASQIILYKLWENESQEFSIDRYGNDFYGNILQVSSWIRQDFFDPMGLFSQPLLFLLEEGENEITFERIKGDFLVGDVFVSGKEQSVSYEEYINGGIVSTSEFFEEVEAELPKIKNSSSIQAGISRSVYVTPFSVRYLKLNMLSGATFNSERESVTYEVVVEQAGYYYLTFKVLQSSMVNGVVYRTLRINGEVPFEEAYSLPIEYDNSWQNYTVGQDAPYLIYFEEGVNEVSLSVNLSPYMEAYFEIQDILKYVNQLTLSIKKLTGNQIDEDRDWEITEFLPTIVSDLNEIANVLEYYQSYLAQLSKTNKLSEAESSIKIAIRNLRYLADNPNDIPKNLSLLSTSSSSVAATLGNTISLILNSSLDMDKFYVHTSFDLPKANSNFFVRVWVNIQRFFISFFDQRFSSDIAEDELEVWINRPKQYVDLIQKMIDDTFTVDTSIKVKVSVMAAEGKLILANSAKTNPDVALGVASWLPYDLGIRGAIQDLTAFIDDEDFATVIGYYQAESLIPLMYDSGLYGLPDTENFYVLFYRTDILSALNLEVPSTWDDVTEMMPILKRYGMNFYLPLSSATSLKSFDATLPFLFQYGSSIYSEDSFTVSLDNEETVNALEMMTELYTIYSVDVTVSSFYNDFRLGLCPIGVGDFGMYTTLLNAAPDIQGLWKIALLPGIEQEDSTIDRSATGAQTANMIFKNTDKLNESWEFLKWWSSTDTQSTFSSLLLSTLGKEYLWNSANVEAFQTLNMNADDLAIVLEQWTYLKELPKVPGSYQVELEISNLWNSVVINRENLRVGLNDGIIKMNKEIMKKMSEFGYVDKYGNIIMAYEKASLSQIEEWLSLTGSDSSE